MGTLYIIGEVRVTSGELVCFISNNTCVLAAAHMFPTTWYFPNGFPKNYFIKTPPLMAPTFMDAPLFELVQIAFSTWNCFYISSAIICSHGIRDTGEFVTIEYVDRAGNMVNMAWPRQDWVGHTTGPIFKSLASLKRKLHQEIGR